MRRDAGGWDGRAGIAACLCGLFSFGIGGCGGGGSSDSTPTTHPPSVPPVVARAYLSATETGTISCHARVSWQSPADILQNSLIEYQILRDGEIVGVASPATRTFEDSASPRSVTAYAPNAERTALVSRTETVSGLSAGITHTYQVVALHSTANQGRVFYFSDALSTPGGAVTPLTPIAASAADSTGFLTDGRARLNYRQVTGADDYLFEFADNPAFRNKTVRGPLAFPADGDSNAIGFAEFNLGAAFSHVPVAGRVYCRLGVRHTSDAPGPLNNAALAPNGDNYLYSDSFYFTIPPIPSQAP